MLPTESVNVGTYIPTVKLVDLVTPPDVPVRVAVYWPTVAVLLAVSVRALLPLVGFGLRDAVTPLGRPDTERLTLPVNPYSENT